MALSDAAAHRMLQRMDTLSAQACDGTHATFQLPGFGLRAIGIDSRIGRILVRAFAHLAVPNTTGPIIEWRLADLPPGGVGALFEPDTSLYGIFEIAETSGTMIEFRGPVLTAYEPAKQRITTLALDGHLVRSDQSAKPLLRLLFGLAAETGWHLAHAAALGFDGTGLLIPGHGGAGKSTLSAACAMAGAAFAGDDFVAVRKIDGAWHAHALFGTMMLFAEQAAHFPSLPKATDADGIENARKVQLFVPEAAPFHPVRTLRIDAVALPRITNAPRSDLQPGRQSANARALLPQSAIASPPVRDPAQVECLLALAAETEPLVYLSGADYSQTVAPLRRRYSDGAHG